MLFFSLFSFLFSFSPVADPSQAVYSLNHSLLASLAVNRAITTNYDDLYERAYAWSRGAKPAVLRVGGRPAISTHGKGGQKRSGYVLKLHGCVNGDAEDIVLAASDYDVIEQAGWKSKHRALPGIVQAQLLTKHMLFVGFSITDPNLERIIQSVQMSVCEETDFSENITVLLADRPDPSSFVEVEVEVEANAFQGTVARRIEARPAQIPATRSVQRALLTRNHVGRMEKTRKRALFHLK